MDVKKRHTKWDLVSLETPELVHSRHKERKRQSYVQACSILMFNETKLERLAYRGQLHRPWLVTDRAGYQKATISHSYTPSLGQRLREGRYALAGDDRKRSADDYLKRIAAFLVWEGIDERRASGPSAARKTAEKSAMVAAAVTTCGQCCRIVDV